MTRRRKSKINNTSAKKQAVTLKLPHYNENLPKEHRYDDEIGSVCNSTLLKVEIMRLNNKAAGDSAAKAHLKHLLGQKLLSYVATRYFVGLLNTAANNPLVKVVIPALEKTAEEYTEVRNHMKLFKDRTMKSRIDAFCTSLEESKWVTFTGEFDENDLDNASLNTFFIAKDSHDCFTDTGDIEGTFSAIAYVDNTTDFVVNAYDNGLVFFKKEIGQNYYEVTLYPDNNVPGAPFVPVRKS